MKKSNNLGGRSGTGQPHGIHWVGLKHPPHKEYALIKGKACRIEAFQGRATAISFIQSRRDWLVEYFRPLALEASGMLLDQWLKDSPWKRKL